VAELEGVAAVVIESSGTGSSGGGGRSNGEGDPRDPGGPSGEGDRPFHTAFDVTGYPTYLELEDGTVRQVHPSLSGVPVPAAV